MNNAYTQIITMLVRIFFIWFTGAMASHLSPAVYTMVNDTITKLGGPETLIASIAGSVGLAILAVWLKLKSRLHLNIALDLPKGSTTDNVQTAANKQSVLSVLQNPQPK